MFYLHVTALRKIGGWSEDLHYFSNLEMIFKYKVSEINPMMCSDIVLTNHASEAVSTSLNEECF